MSLERLIFSLVVMLIPVCAFTTETLDDEWFDDDLEARVATVNVGDLVFLSEPPREAVHHHHSRITLDSDSLDNGWVTVIQCHSQLDAVSRSQVLYHETRARELSIISYENIQARMGRRSHSTAF